jgi:hypothetical protein
MLFLNKSYRMTRMKMMTTVTIMTITMAIKLVVKTKHQGQLEGRDVMTRRLIQAVCHI